MKSTIALSSSGSTFEGYLSMPDGNDKHPGLILIHEVWGLNDHIKNVTDRYAEEGFVVLAPDIISDTGILEKAGPTLSDDLRNPEKRHEAQAKLRELMQPISTQEFADASLAKLQACFEHLLSHERCTGTVGILGFCFGGTYAFFFATKEPRLKACVPFYGQPPKPLDDVKSIHCPVFAFYGGQDENLMKLLPDLEAAMKKYGKDFTYKVYPNTGHAFFNDTNKRAYNKEAAGDAWQLSLEFLKKSLV